MQKPSAEHWANPGPYLNDRAGIVLLMTALNSTALAHFVSSPALLQFVVDLMSDPPHARILEAERSDEMFEHLTDVFETLVVLLLGERVPGGDEQSDGPFDDLERDECCHGAVEGELLGCWETNDADEGQV